MTTNPSAHGEINALVADFTSRLSTLVRRSALEQVVASLGGGPTPVARRRGRPPGSKNKPRGAKPKRAPAAKQGGRRTAEGVAQVAEGLLAFVRKNPGKRGEQIAAALRTDVNTMRLPMKSLIKQKKVKTKGQRRGMTYFPV